MLHWTVAEESGSQDCTDIMLTAVSEDRSDLWAPTPWAPGREGALRCIPTRWAQCSPPRVLAFLGCGFPAGQPTNINSTFCNSSKLISPGNNRANGCQAWNVWLRWGKTWRFFRVVLRIMGNTLVTIKSFYSPSVGSVLDAVRWLGKRPSPVNTYRKPNSCFIDRSCFSERSLFLVMCEQVLACNHREKTEW